MIIKFLFTLFIFSNHIYGRNFIHSKKAPYSYTLFYDVYLSNEITFQNNIFWRTPKKILAEELKKGGFKKDNHTSANLQKIIAGVVSEKGAQKILESKENNIKSSESNCELFKIETSSGFSGKKEYGLLIIGNDRRGTEFSMLELTKHKATPWDYWTDGPFQKSEDDKMNSYLGPYNFNH